MAKYKVGDVVRIRPDLSEEQNYPPVGINNIMCDYKGREATITSVGFQVAEGSHFYKLDIDMQTWCWIDEMFEESTILHDPNSLYNIWEGVC